MMMRFARVAALTAALASTILAAPALAQADKVTTPATDGVDFSLGWKAIFFAILVVLAWMIGFYGIFPSLLRKGRRPLDAYGLTAVTIWLVMWAVSWPIFWKDLILPKNFLGGGFVSDWGPSVVLGLLGPAVALLLHWGFRSRPGKVQST